MRVIKLKIENLRKIEALEITPSGNVIKVEGKNGHGKTTILDSIMFALSGEVPDGVVKKGKDKSNIEVNLGDYVIKKVITANNKYLTVETKDGLVVKSPQTFLNSLVGKIAFDPMSFMHMEDKEKSAVLKKVLGVQDKIDELKNKESDLVLDRRDYGREVDRLKAFIPEKIEKVEAPASLNEVVAEINELIKKRGEEQSKYNKNIELHNMRNAKNNEIKEMEEEIERIKDYVKTLDKQLKGVDLNNNPADQISVDIENLNKQLNDRKESINKYDKYQAYLNNKKEYDSKCKQHEKAEQEITQVRLEMDNVLKSVKLPIKELVLTDDGLLYKGFNFDNLAESERLKVSVAISMAMNPKLKVILIRDGSLLDDDSLKTIEEIVNKEGYQCWLEVVKDESDDKNAIFIYEGEVKSQNTLKS